MTNVQPERLERSDSLWVAVAAPIIWSAHFTLVYVTVAFACGRFGSRGAALLLVAYTAAAVAGIGYFFAHGWHRYVSLGGGRRVAPDASRLMRAYDADSADDRQRFMAFTTMLLAGLSLIGTAYATLALMLVEGCI